MIAVDESNVNDPNLFLFRLYRPITIFIWGMACTSGLPLIIVTTVLCNSQFDDGNNNKTNNILPSSDNQSCDATAERIALNYAFDMPLVLIGFILPVLQFIFKIVSTPYESTSRDVDADIMTHIAFDSDELLVNKYITHIYNDHELIIRNPLRGTHGTYDMAFLAKVVGANKVLSMLEYLQGNALNQWFEFFFELNTKIILKHPKIIRGIPEHLIGHILSFLDLKWDIRLMSVNSEATRRKDYSEHLANPKALLLEYDKYVKKVHPGSIQTEQATEIEIDPESLEPISASTPLLRQRM